MLEAEPKIEGAKKFRRPMRAAGQPTKKEFVTKVLGLESHTFDIGNAKYSAKYKKTRRQSMRYPTTYRESIKVGPTSQRQSKSLAFRLCNKYQGTQRQKLGRPLLIPETCTSDNRTLRR
jgi:hypothetical protein